MILTEPIKRNIYQSIEHDTLRKTTLLRNFSNLLTFSIFGRELQILPDSGLDPNSTGYGSGSG
jgi:hypothetical protein